MSENIRPPYSPPRPRLADDCPCLLDQAGRIVTPCTAHEFQFLADEERRVESAWERQDAQRAERERLEGQP